MSTHHTFFGKIFGSAWDGVKGWFSDLFKNANHDFLQIAVDVTQKVKDVLSSSAIDVFTAIIPTTIDDTIVKILREKLPVILADELLLQSLNSTSTETDIQELSKKILDSFGGLPDEKKEEFYTSIAAKIYILLQQVKSGVKVTFGQAAALVESAYQAWLKSKQP